MMILWGRSIGSFSNGPKRSSTRSPGSWSGYWLLVSGAFLRFGRSGLRGGFFGRYGLTVMAVCLGGAILGPLLVSATIVLGTDVYVPSSPSEFASIALFAATAGGAIGAVEGVVLGFPLAGVLGMFGDHTVARNG